MAAASLLLSPIKMCSVTPSEAFPSLYDPSLRRLSIPKEPKRTLVVKTESNVWKEETKKPISPCVRCEGKGKVNCCYCRGRGRTNCVHLAVLPKGEWPKWCKNCGGSGIDWCLQCAGTGEYQHSMGFQFARIIERDQNDQKKNPS